MKLHAILELSRPSFGVLCVVILGVATAPSASPPLLGATLLGQAAASDPAKELARLVEDVVAFRDESNPLPVPEGTDERYHDRLPAISVEHFEARAQASEEFLQRLLQIDFDRLDTQDRIDAEVLELQLRNALAQAQFRTYLVSVSHGGGFYSGFSRMPTNRVFRNVEDYDDYIARMQSFQEHVRLQIGLLRQGLEAGITLPQEVMSNHDGTIRPHLVERVDQSVFYVPLANLPRNISEVDRERIVRDGTLAIRESVIPGFQELLEFLQEEYIPNARETVGFSDLPGGREYYEHRTRFFTTLEVTPEEVHEIGLAEAERLQGEMEAIMREVGFDGSYLEFREHLRTDPRFFAATPEDYLREAAYVLKRMDGALLELFEELPSTPYGVQAMPEYFAVTGPGAYYDVGSPESRAGFPTFNLLDLSARPLYSMEALSYHEGVPGHHLQIMLHRENEEISDFRRSYEIGAFVEGWALYAERLGAEVGFLSDPYSRFGQLSMEHYRALRLVVDTGLHSKGWTRDQALDYLEANTGRRSIAAVDRYISVGGQALSYKMGELKVTELRKRAEEALGNHFDVRTFHRHVLKNGSIPLIALERQIDEYIAAALDEVESGAKR